MEGRPIIHNVADKKGNIKTSPEEIRQTFADYYKDLLKKEQMQTEEGRKKEELTNKMIKLLAKESSNKKVKASQEQIEKGEKAKKNKDS